MTFKQVMAGIFATAEGTFYKWKKEERPIITLLERYFSKEDLEEFLVTGKVSRYEKSKLMSDLFEEIEYRYTQQFIHGNWCSLRSYYYLLANASTSSTVQTFKHEILELYNQGLIDNYDVSSYFENISFNETIEAYINANLLNDWSIFMESDIEPFFKMLHRLLIQAAKKNVYDEIFCDGPGVSIVPEPPKMPCSTDESREYEKRLTELIKSNTRLTNLIQLQLPDLKIQ